MGVQLAQSAEVGRRGEFERTETCGKCGVPGATKFCGQCKVQSYCSQKCQRAHWREHKVRCKPRVVETVKYVVGVRLYGDEYRPFAERGTWRRCWHGARVGIRNEGNTCYLSAVVQALTYSPLATALLEIDPIGNARTRGGGANAMHELAAHVRKVWAMNEALAARDAAKRASVGAGHRVAATAEISIAGTLMRCSRHAGRMEDAHEALTHVFARLLEACAVGYEGTQDEAWEKSTLVYDVFGIDLAQAVVCGACDHASKTTLCELTLRLNATLGLSETDMARATSVDRTLESRLLARRRRAAAEVFDSDEDEDLYSPRDGPPPTSVDALMALFFESERIEDFACEKCKERGRCEKRGGFARAPNSLALYVDRVPAFGALFGKLNRVVSFDRYVDLKPFLADDLAAGDTLYRLYAVVTHLDFSGSTFFGHYVCYVRDGNDAWWLLDDETVKPMNWDQVRRVNPYLLFYSKAHPPVVDDDRDSATTTDADTVLDPQSPPNVSISIMAGNSSVRPLGDDNDDDDVVVTGVTDLYEAD
ncbi:hypothetical protein CTAYLR_007377 [Chrysophaeum taylorii]|uniref:ubiquitinyl hydrolase 1 n=1 Tax=Chrysophaeum taylorii TaxID=2483200 RepID=A0AAD7U4L1_9STRA|nr:hypothetical protein CTAYLR_007377 [Chrysophaeum taylorii]